MTALGALVRWAHLASGTVLVGTFVLLLLVPRRSKPTAERWELDALSLSRICILVALLAGIGALAIQTVLLEGRASAALEPQAIGRVLWTTRFGAVWIVRHGLLLLVAPFLVLSQARQAPADRIALRLHCLLLAGLALGAAAWAGHAAAVEPTPRLTASMAALHLIAVGAWIGGLLPLVRLLDLAGRPAGADARPFAVLAARRFATVALVSVVVLVATGAWNTWSQVGDVAALAGTPYGRLLLLKLALLVPILAIAAVNRRRLIPALSGEAETVGRPAMLRLRTYAGVELSIALAVIAVVAWMTVTPPARHAQPTWPFGFRLSWDATAGLPGGRLRVLIGAQLLVLGAVVALGGAILGRRRAPLAVAGAVAVLGVILGLPPLLVDAYPTTYRRSAVPYQAVSVAAGADLYGASCAACHVAGGRDLTGPRLDRHTAGDLFWWISSGLPGTQMPAFAASLSEEQRWDLVNFLRARAAGGQARTLGSRVEPPPPRIEAPDFAYAVGPSPPFALRDHRGRRVVLLVLFTLPRSRPRLAQLAQAYETLVVMGAEVIAVPTRPDPRILARLGPSPRIFFPVVTDGGPDIVRTYDLFRPGEGTQEHLEFLIDRRGYVRARTALAGDPAPELSPLLGEIQRLNEEPQAAPLPDDHVH